jgi:MFS family permease
MRSTPTASCSAWVRPTLGAGLAFLPMTLLIALASLVAGRAAARVGTKLPTVAGQAIMAAGLLALCLAATLGADTLVLAALMVPVGLGGAGPAEDDLGRPLPRRPLHPVRQRAAHHPVEGLIRCG